MNFLRSVLFEEDETELENGENEASSSNTVKNSNDLSKFWDLNNIVDTLVSKSEEVYKEYKGDFEEFGVGLKQETESLVGSTSLNVKHIPVSLEAGAQAAQESLEKVGSTIEEFGSTFWRGTQEIISQVKEAVAMVENEANLNFNSNNNNKSYNYSSSLPKSGKYSRYDALVNAMQRDSSTYCDEPEDMDEYVAWKEAFKLEEREKDIEDTLKDNAFMQELHSRIVPMIVEHEIFWSRYFYRLHKLHEAENARANLVKRATTQEEELSWDVDEEDNVKGNEIKDEIKTMEKDEGKDEEGKEKENSKDDENKNEIAGKTKEDETKEELMEKEGEEKEDKGIKSEESVKDDKETETVFEGKDKIVKSLEIEGKIEKEEILKTDLMLPNENGSMKEEESIVKDDWQLINEEEKNEEKKKVEVKDEKERRETVEENRKSVSLNNSSSEKVDEDKVVEKEEGKEEEKENKEKDVNKSEIEMGKDAKIGSSDDLKENAQESIGMDEEKAKEKEKEKGKEIEKEKKEEKKEKEGGPSLNPISSKPSDNSKERNRKSLTGNEEDDNDDDWGEWE